MKTKQILIGAAILGGAFWLYSRNKSKGTSETQSSDIEKSQTENGGDETADTQDGQYIETKQGLNPTKGSAIKLGKPNTVGGVKGIAKPSKKRYTVKEEDAIMDSAYEQSKSILKGTAGEGLLRYKMRLKKTVFESVKKQIPNFRSAWQRLQERKKQQMAMKQTNANSDENASFAFNGHSF